MFLTNNIHLRDLLVHQNGREYQLLQPFLTPFCELIFRQFMHCYGCLIYQKNDPLGSVVTRIFFHRAFRVYFRTIVDT